MNVFKLSSWKTASIMCLTLSALTLTQHAQAQALSPMRGEVKSFADSFALKVYPANPYEHSIRMVMKVYDLKFNQIKAQISPSVFTLGSRFTRPVSVIVPFNEHPSMKVRVCAEAIPFPNQSQATMVKAQVCGKFLGIRIQ